MSKSNQVVKIQPLSKSIRQLSQTPHRANGKYYCWFYQGGVRKGPIYFSRDREESIKQWKDKDREFYINESNTDSAGAVPESRHWTIDQLVTRFFTVKKPLFLPKTFAEYETAGAALVSFAGDKPVSWFGFRAFAQLREFICEPIDGAKLTLRTVNAKIDHVKKIFKYGAELGIGIDNNQLAVLLAFEHVKPSERKCNAALQIMPVPQDLFGRILPFLSDEIASMARLQLEIGCRAADVCNARYDEVVRQPDQDTRCQKLGITTENSKGCWWFFPTKYKGSTNGKENYYYVLGPDSQALLKPFFDDPERLGDEFIFNPARAVAAQNRAKRAVRKTKVQPSQQNRRKANPQGSKPGEHYDTGSYDRALKRAQDRAVKQGAIEQSEIDQLFRSANGEARFRQRRYVTSHQFRKTKLNDTAKKHGIEVAAIMGNHSDSKVTATNYAFNAERERKIQTMIDIASQEN